MADKSEGQTASAEKQKKKSNVINESVKPPSYSCYSESDVEVTPSLKRADSDNKNDVPGRDNDVLLSKNDSLLTSVEGLAAANKNFEARIAQLEKSRSNSRPNLRDEEESRTAESSAQEEKDAAGAEDALGHRTAFLMKISGQFLTTVTVKRKRKLSPVLMHMSVWTEPATTSTLSWQLNLTRDYFSHQI